MAHLKYQPARHDHEAFIARAREREGFTEAYDALEFEYQLAAQTLRHARVLASPKTP
jgi:hypothetical protein